MTFELKLETLAEEEQALAVLNTERRYLENEEAKLFDWDSQQSEEELDFCVRADHVADFIEEIEDSGIGVHLFPFEDE